MIPCDYMSDSVERFDCRYHDPVDTWMKSLSPFRLSYVVGQGQSFFLHHCNNAIDTKTFPLDCRRIKLARRVVDLTLQLQPSSSTFEEELYRFFTYLNTNVYKVSALLDLTFIESTRFLPQFVSMWTPHFKPASIEKNTVSRDELQYYGPPEDSSFPIRVIRGQLPPCTSRHTVLSLNNDIEAKKPYTMHLVEKMNALIPLAYNPLENPISFLPSLV